VLCGAVCAWAGVPLGPATLAQRTAELTALFETAGSIGPRHWSGRLARTRAERWAAETIEGIRAGRITLPPEAPARRIAEHADGAGTRLDVRTAAVELLNLLRPTVAVSV